MSSAIKNLSVTNAPKRCDICSRNRGRLLTHIRGAARVEEMVTWGQRPRPAFSRFFSVALVRGWLRVESCDDLASLVVVPWPQSVSSPAPWKTDRHFLLPRKEVTTHRPYSRPLAKETYLRRKHCARNLARLTWWHQYVTSRLANWTGTQLTNCILS